MLRLVLSALLLLLTSCQGVSDLTADLEGTRDATFRFWAKLQGVQYRGNPEIKRLQEGNVEAARSADVDAVVEGWSNLAQKHADMARELAGLDAENVDSIATGYRDQLVKIHQALSAETKIQADATKNRDEAKILQAREDLYSKLREYADLWKKRTEVMAKLSETYGGDFDAQD